MMCRSFRTGFMWLLVSLTLCRFDFSSLIDADNEKSANQIHEDLIAKLHTVLRPFLLRRRKQLEFTG